METATTKKEYSEEIMLPEGTGARADGKTLYIKGAKGELSRKFPDPNVEIGIEENKIMLAFRRDTKKERKIKGSIKAHIRNMIRGTSELHAYRLKICSGHFPMNVAVSGKEFIVKNFLGERTPRKMPIRGELKISVAGNEITIEGISKEEVSQCAASIEQLTRRQNFDRRVFQDGIYIISKDGKLVK